MLETTEALTAAGTSKDAILEAARHLLMKHGYGGFSMRELSRMSGLAKGTIYHHFHDKQEIYLSVLERDIMIADQRIAWAAQTEGDCTAKLRAIIRSLFYLQQEHHFITNVTGLGEMAGMDVPVRQLVKKHHMELVKPIAGVIDSGMAGGIIRPIDVEKTVMSLFGMIQSVVAYHLLLDRAAIDDDLVDHTLGLLLQGIQNRS